MTNLAHPPQLLGDNRVPVYYKGGTNIDEFRGLDAPGGGPEDWVGSTTVLPAQLQGPTFDDTVGISRLPDGTLLTVAIAEDPQGWLGPGLAAALDGDTGLLVKLLDAGQRLPVHCHPPRPFARRLLDSFYGKTEGWIVMRAEGLATVWLGFHHTVAAHELRRWIDTQRTEAMLDAMNAFTVRRGDVLYVPAGVPHAIGPGIMVTELQEPTSYSVLLEYQQFGLTETQATLELGWTLALECLDRSAYSGERVNVLQPPARVLETNEEGSREELFSAQAAEFFRAERVRAQGRLSLGPPELRILVVESGGGSLIHGLGNTPIRRGQTWILPFALGPVSINGPVEAISCLPPDPATLSRG